MEPGDDCFAVPADFALAVVGAVRLDRERTCVAVSKGLAQAEALESEGHQRRQLDGWRDRQDSNGDLARGEISG